MSAGVPVRLPRALVEHLAGRPADPAEGVSGQDWLDGLPATMQALLDRWELTADGPARHGVAAVVVPVLRQDGARAALKVTWPHTEARHEHLALRAWAGRSAVRLLAADPARWALLLERLDPEQTLDRQDDLVACRVVGGLLGRLDRPALPQVDTLSTYLDRLDAEARSLAGRGGGLPRRIVDRGRALAAELRGEPGVDGRLVHTDLHGQNVLHRGSTGEWVAIDPKPLSALPEFAVAPMLWNRWFEVVAADDPRERLLRRLETVCEHAGFDAELARTCTTVRMLRNALSALESPGRHTPGQVTTAVTVIKAMQPA